jgi:hypothetical protein
VIVKNQVSQVVNDYFGKHVIVLVRLDVQYCAQVKQDREVKNEEYEGWEIHKSCHANCYRKLKQQVNYCCKCCDFGADLVYSNAFKQNAVRSNKLGEPFL